MIRMFFSVLLLPVILYFVSQTTVFATGLSEIQKERIAQGQYLAYAADCFSCHTSPIGASFAGGQIIDSPNGGIYSTNITPDPVSGIGDYNYLNFSQALRNGITKDGHHLYPAMPYPSFAKLNDNDIHALYLFFSYGVKPVLQINHKNNPSWPLKFRWLVSIWDTIILPEEMYQRNISESELWNRGAYLVQGIGHCGSCHTPRGIGLQEKALDQRDPLYLSGNMDSVLKAPSLRSGKNQGLNNWSEQDIIYFLRTGTVSKTTPTLLDAKKPHNNQYFTEYDQKAIAHYLKSLPKVDQDTLK